VQKNARKTNRLEGTVKKREAKNKAVAEEKDLLGEEAAEAAYPGCTKKRSVGDDNCLTDTMANVETFQSSRRGLIIEDESDKED
jgi:hypothetical protein